MFILMLIVVFGLVIFSFSFIVRFIAAIKYDTDFKGTPHAFIIAACVTFLVFYFGG